jgi:hypothetical protein
MKLKPDCNWNCKECEHQIHNIDLIKLKEIAQKAILAQPTEIRNPNGSGRVYVSFMKLRKASKQAKVLESVGFRITKRPYSNTNYIYIGYDNNHGKELAYGEAVAKAFNESGICCYCDGDDD